MDKGRLFTVFLVVLIDLLGFGIVLPLLPFYAAEFGASAIVIGLLYSVFSFAQLIFSPIWGSLSDRIGRRPIMLLCSFGSIFAYIIFGLAGSISVLLFSRLFAGVMGGSISTAQAYIADVTSSEDRARGMGLLGAAFGIGFMLGPILTAGLIHPAFHNFFGTLGFESAAAWLTEQKYALPGFFAAFLSLCSFMMVFFKLEETVDKERAKQQLPKWKPTGFFTPQFWRQLSLNKERGSGFFVLLIASTFLLTLGQANLYSAFPLFSEAVLDMSVQQVSVQFFYVGLIAIVVQGGLIRPLTRKFPEERIFLAGNIIMVIGMLLIGFSTSVWMLTLFLCLMGVGNSLNLPTMQSLISKEAPPDQVGTVMGSSQGFSGLGRTIGPTWGGFFSGFNPALPFFLTAAAVSLTIWFGIKIVLGKNARREAEASAGQNKEAV